MMIHIEVKTKKDKSETEASQSFNQTKTTEEKLQTIKKGEN